MNFVALDCFKWAAFIGAEVFNDCIFVGFGFVWCPLLIHWRAAENFIFGSGLGIVADMFAIVLLFYWIEL